MCYFKLEDAETALKQTIKYLEAHPLSLTANNLKASIQYSLHGKPQDALETFKYIAKHSKNGNLIEENDILSHNFAVFDTENTAKTNKGKVFSQLVDIIPEAKTNLALFYLKTGQTSSALGLVKNMETNSTKEFIIKAITYYQLSLKGEKKEEHERKAQTYFNSIGESAFERDKIDGRLCMASFLRMSGAFEDEHQYLESVDEFMQHDATFNWNYANNLAALNKNKEALKVLLRIMDNDIVTSSDYILLLCRLMIADGQPE